MTWNHVALHALTFLSFPPHLLPSQLYQSDGFSKINPDLKKCVLKLWDQGQEIEDIVDTLGISRPSIYHWQVIFDQHGCVIRLPIAPKGPEWIITHAVLTAVHTLFETDSDLYLDKLVLWLAIEHNIAVSILTLHVTLKNVGLTRKLLHKIVIERDEELWEQWREMQGSEDFLQDGSQFVCVDQTSKNEQTFARKHGHAYPGEHTELKDVFVQGDRYSLVTAWLSTAISPLWLSMAISPVMLYWACSTPWTFSSSFKKKWCVLMLSYYELTLTTTSSHKWISIQRPDQSLFSITVTSTIMKHLSTLFTLLAVWFSIYQHTPLISTWLKNLSVHVCYFSFCLWLWNEGQISCVDMSSLYNWMCYWWDGCRMVLTCRLYLMNVYYQSIIQV